MLTGFIKSQSKLLGIEPAVAKSHMTHLVQSGERAPVPARHQPAGNLQRACSWLGGMNHAAPPAKPVVKRLVLVSPATSL
jgi:hypothetical protein